MPHARSPSVNHAAAPAEPPVLFRFATRGARTGAAVQSMVCRLATAVVRAPQCIALCPVGRLGLSGAQVYEATIDGGRPYIFKIDDPPDIEQERQGAAALSNWTTDASLENRDFIAEGDLAGLVYRHCGGDTDNAAERLRELEDHIRKADVTATTSRLREFYRHTSALFSRAATPTSGDLIELYEDKERNYIRRDADEDPADRIAQVLRDVKAHFGDNIVDPRSVLERLRRHKSIPYTRGPVHGDLHPRNVVYDVNDQPHVIDFKWSTADAHQMVDYSLMEISLRFLWVPNGYDLRKGASLNRAMSFEVPRRFQVGRCYDSLGQFRLRVRELVPIIREAAKDASRTAFWYNEYLVSLFLVLYGVLVYDSYNVPLAVHALGLLGNDLKERGVV